MRQNFHSASFDCLNPWSLLVTSLTPVVLSEWHVALRQYLRSTKKRKHLKVMCT